MLLHLEKENDVFQNLDMKASMFTRKCLFLLCELPFTWHTKQSPREEGMGNKHQILKTLAMRYYPPTLKVFFLLTFNDSEGLLVTLSFYNSIKLH